MSLTKPTLDNLRAAGTTVGDVYFPQTELLLPLNGANGATSTTDSSNSNHTVTFNGNAQISTAQSKFGGSSVLLDGASDTLQLGDVSAFVWASSNWTIECWIYMNSIADRDHIFSHSHAYNGVEFRFCGTDGLCASIGGGSWTLNESVLHSTGVSTGQWHHVALVRNGSSIDGYLDGTKGTTKTFSGTIGTPTNSPYLGSNRGSQYWFDGYIDNFRITIGLARYTSSFTPPTTAYLTSAGDVNKQIIINSAADGVAIGTGGINQSRIAKAWVNFNGTGTVAIRESYNISSLTDRGTGLYTLNYSSNLSSANCSGAGAAVDATGDATERNRVVNLIPNNVSSSYVNAYSIDSPTGADDCEIVTFLIFGD